MSHDSQDNSRTLHIPVTDASTGAVPVVVRVKTQPAPAT